ncbi:MAG: glyoxylate/hydroxypyruvate reductase A [Balneolaceae bacterium]
MSILLVARNRNMIPFREELLRLDPHLDVEIWPTCKRPQRVRFIVAWDQPDQFFSRFSNLEVVSSMGAGVEHLVTDPDLPAKVTITRLVSPGLKEQIRDYVESSLYRILRRCDDYLNLQRSARWEKLDHTTRDQWRVGMLGLGELGGAVAASLASSGWTVHGWSRSRKSIPGCISWYGRDQLPDMLSNTQILINLLPLTRETEGILDLELFKRLAEPSWLIQAGRGEHLVDEDLIYALDQNLLEGAFLDVFREEPLPDSHPFWNRDSIRITPHIASVSRANELAPQLLENYKRMISNQKLLYTVDRTRGY